METDSRLSETQSAAIAERLREEMARRRMSRQSLADAARISISTLEKAMNGSRPFTTASVVRLEQALGIALRDKPSVIPPSNSQLGGYGRAGVAWMEGDYLTIRQSFEVADAIYAYRTQIAWDETLGGLAFRESDRLDAPFAQKGVVSVPNTSGHIYLYTNEQGQMRLILLCRPQITGDLYGLLTTLAAGPGGNLTPVSTPVALLPWARQKSHKLGRILPGDAGHSDCRKHLAAITGSGFAKLLG